MVQWTCHHVAGCLRGVHLSVSAPLYPPSHCPTLSSLSAPLSSLTASAVLSLGHLELCLQDPVLSLGQMETRPPSFPPQPPPGGNGALAIPSSKKPPKNKRVPAEGYLMSFPVLASDAKSTGILFQGGEDSDVTWQNQGTKSRGGRLPFLGACILVQNSYAKTKLCPW